MVRRPWRLLPLAALAASYAHASAVIDTGFTQDGRTTYCQGVHSEEGPLIFEELAPTSVGKCPIDLQLTLSATTVAPNANLDVSWTAIVHGGALAVNLLPKAVDTAANPKKAKDVTASLLRACVVGTNCGGAAMTGVVTPTAITGDTNTETGAFDAGGNKKLKSFRFTFPTAGDYLIVGTVQLPGDGAIKTSEFVVFQKITVSGSASAAATTPAPAATNATTPATVAPASNDADPSTASTPVTTTPVATSKAPTATNESAVTSNNGTGASSKKGVNWQTVGIVAVVAIVAAVAFVLNYERRDLKRIEAARAFRAERTPQEPPGTNESGGIMARKTTLSKSPMATPTAFHMKPLDSPSSRSTLAAPKPRMSKAPPPLSQSSYGNPSSRMSSNVFQTSIDSVDDIEEVRDPRQRRSTVALLEASPSGSDAWSIGSLQDPNTDVNARPSHYSFL